MCAQMTTKRIYDSTTRCFNRFKVAGRQKKKKKIDKKSIIFFVNRESSRIDEYPGLKVWSLMPSTIVRFACIHSHRRAFPNLPPIERVGFTLSQ